MEIQETGHKTKKFFILLVLISFVLILIYNLLTPMTTDDFSYTLAVRKAGSIWELFSQEKTQYMTWNGRSVNHIILRFFLYANSRLLFKICNSIVFVLLSMLIYCNVSGKKKYDIFTYIVIQLLLWFSAVSFGQTILWETGACNYLWGTTIILGFVTFIRKSISWKKITFLQIVLLSFLSMLFGIIAGWCNENTSGGGILLTLFFMILSYVQNKKRPPIWTYIGLFGMISGLAIMVLAPGNKIRSAAQEESHTGIMALAARILKCTLKQKELFIILFAICIIAFIILFVRKKNLENLNMVAFIVVSLCTSYALVLTTEPMPRAYFGAGIFLIIATVQGITSIGWEIESIKIIKLSVVSIFIMCFLFLYIENGAVLSRIYRDSSTREEYILQCIQDGKTNLVVPAMREEYDTLYSDAVRSDIQKDAGYWVNTMYADYYQVDSIFAIDWDTWEKIKQ